MGTLIILSAIDQFIKILKFYNWEIRAQIIKSQKANPKIIKRKIILFFY